jgi:CheY-like chemotaxis protein
MVVDDQEIFRSVLRDLVTATEGFRLVGDAASSEAALARMAALQPDFIVMDVCLGTGDGVETAGSILRRYPDRLVLLISLHELMGAPPVGPSGETIPFVSKADLSCDVLRQAWHAHLTTTAYGGGARPLSSGGRAPLAHRPGAEMLAIVETAADFPVAGTTAGTDENRDA